MLIYSKKVDEKMKLFGTLNNVPSDDDELLTYTDGEGKEVEPALSLSQSFVDGGNHSIKRVEDGKEIKVFIGDVNVIPGDGDSPEPPEPPEGPWLMFSSDEPFTLNVSSNKKSWSGVIEYSADTVDWETWSGSVINSGSNNKLYLRGTGNNYITGNNSSAYWKLTGSNIHCYGNIENLLDYETVANGEHPTMAPYCYFVLFFNNSSLISAPKLPATTLTQDCYDRMFKGCTSLVKAPQLPATTLAIGCYLYMFEGCTSLTTSPELPATTLVRGCYSNMFKDCTALTTAPVLPATTLVETCYQSMFAGCTSLMDAPELPAMTLNSMCYQSMFNSCSSLIKIPKLPATKLKSSCYQSMFSGCTSIKLSTTQIEDYTIPYRIPTTGTGAIESGALNHMFDSTGGTFTGTPEINTTYYLHKDNHIV